MSKIVALESARGKGRTGDALAPPYRTNRFVQDGGSWYYRTRENKSVGPYNDRTKAEKSARAFAELAKSLNSNNLDELISSHLDGLVAQHAQHSDQSLRAGEWEVPEYRSARFYQRNGQWYFHTREGQPVGPYKNYQEAESSAKLFTDFTQAIKPHFIRGLIAAMNENE